MNANKGTDGECEGMSIEKKPYIVGLTGGIASGKTTATDYLQTLGACVVDADVESRALTAPGGDALPAIREMFGDEVFHEDGTLDRRALGKLVFDDVGSRRALEGIMHPMVQRHMLEKVNAAARAGEKIVFLSVPLLYETGMDALCDETWVLTLDHDVQVCRLMARNNLDREAAEKRIASQMSSEDRVARGDEIIRTGRQIAQTQQELSSLYRDLRRRVQ